MTEYSACSVGHLTTQADHLWRECRALRRALRAIVSALEDPFRDELALDHYERLERAVEKAKELLR